MVVIPLALLTTMSGPNSASKSTASQMTEIATDVHTSGTTVWGSHRRGSGRACEGGSCEVVAMSRLLSLTQPSLPRAWGGGRFEIADAELTVADPARRR